MSWKSRPKESSVPIPALPTQVRLADGTLWTVTGKIWRFPHEQDGRGEVRINTELLECRPLRRSGEGAQSLRGPTCLHGEFSHLLRLWLLDHLERSHPRGADIKLEAALYFEKWLRTVQTPDLEPNSVLPEDLTLPLFDAFRRWCIDHVPSRGFYPRVVLRFYAFCLRRGYRGFREVTIARMKKLRFPAGVRGLAVRINHPTRGAFTWEEMEQIWAAIRERVGTPEQLSIVLLLLFTGARPIQLVRLRCKHLRRICTKSGTTYLLALPQAKRHGLRNEAEVEWRELDPMIGTLLEEVWPDGGANGEAPLLHFLKDADPTKHIRDSLREWADQADLRTIRCTATPESQEGWINARNERIRRTRREVSAYIEYAQEHPDHPISIAEIALLTRGTADGLSEEHYRDLLDRIGELSAGRPVAPARPPLRIIDLPIPHEGYRLRLFPYRFRRTMATTLAEHGASVEQIAAALGDKSLAMAAVYVENTAATVDILDRTLDKNPEWLALLKLFRGEIIAEDDPELPVILGGVPYFSNYEKYADIGIIGECASPVPCELYPPLSCYLCRFFRADPAGRHERQLDQIRANASHSVGREADRVVQLFKVVDGAICQLLSFISKLVDPRIKIKNQRRTEGGSI